MGRTEFLLLALKAVLAWLGLSLSGWYFGKAIGGFLIPGLSLIINQLYPDYSSWVILIPGDYDYSIRLNALVLDPFHVGGKLWLTPGQELTAGTDLMHTLVPLVIELSILLVWPVKALGERLLLLSLGLVTGMLVIFATAPFVLLGNLEIYLQDMAVAAQVPRPEPWVLTWMVLCEMGGRWALPIIVAIGCIRSQQMLVHQHKRANSTLFNN